MSTTGIDLSDSDRVGSSFNRKIDGPKCNLISNFGGAKKSIFLVENVSYGRGAGGRCFYSDEFELVSLATSESHTSNGSFARGLTSEVDSVLVVGEVMRDRAGLVTL